MNQVVANIIQQLAQERRVETIVLGVTHSKALTADLKDLVQTIYLALLEYDEDKIVDLWENGEIGFFIARMVINQYRTNHSPFRDQICKFRSLTQEIQELQREIHETP